MCGTYKTVQFSHVVFPDILSALFIFSHKIHASALWKPHHWNVCGQPFWVCKFVHGFSWQRGKAAFCFRCFQVMFGDQSLQALFQWVGFLWYCLWQLPWKRASHQNKPKPWILLRVYPCLFSAVSSAVFFFLALTFKHCSGFSCPNTFPFDLLPSLLITEDTVRFENHFLSSCGRTSKNSRLLNCFRINNNLWKI